MKALGLIVATMLFWGNSVWAVHSETSNLELRQLEVISAWTAHLNRFFPHLEVRVKTDLGDPQSVQQTLEELEALENVLHGSQELPSGTLKILACSRAVCDGGGGGGKCTTCF